MMLLDKLFRIRMCKVRYVTAILPVSTFNCLNPCLLNLWLRFQYRYPLLGTLALTLSMEAKQYLDSFKDHLIKASHLIYKPPKGRNIMASLTQDNLGAYKDNPIKDNLWPLAVRPLPI